MRLQFWLKQRVCGFWRRKISLYKPATSRPIKPDSHHHPITSFFTKFPPIRDRADAGPGPGCPDLLPGPQPRPVFLRSGPWLCWRVRVVNKGSWVIVKDRPVLAWLLLATLLAKRAQEPRQSIIDVFFDSFQSLSLVSCLPGSLAVLRLRRRLGSSSSSCGTSRLERRLPVRLKLYSRNLTQPCLTWPLSCLGKKPIK